MWGSGMRGQLPLDEVDGKTRPQPEIGEDQAAVGLLYYSMVVGVLLHTFVAARY